jgi:hypothetical protein
VLVKSSTALTVKIRVRGQKRRLLGVGVKYQKQFTNAFVAVVKYRKGVATVKLAKIKLLSGTKPL